VSATPATGIDMARPRGDAICAHTIRAAYDGELLRDSAIVLCLQISTAGPYALVAWSTAETASMSLFQRRGNRRCRTTSSAGAFREAHIVGFDVIDRATAHRFFTVRPTTSTADAR
jgi:hypothetical protein